MDDFRDLMYDLIIESLVDKLENYEITMEDAEIFSEAAYDELFYEANRYMKELTKKQNKFRQMNNQYNKAIDNEQKKQGKFAYLYGTNRFWNPLSGTEKNTTYNALEKHAKNEGELRKKKALLKSPSQSHGYNRDILYGDEPTSLKSGRDRARLIAMTRDKIKEGKELKKDAAAAGNMEKVKNLRNSIAKLQDFEFDQRWDARMNHDKEKAIKEKSLKFKELNGKDCDFTKNRYTKQSGLVRQDALTIGKEADLENKRSKSKTGKYYNQDLPYFLSDQRSKDVLKKFIAKRNEQRLKIRKNIEHKCRNDDVMNARLDKGKEENRQLKEWEENELKKLNNLSILDFKKTNKSPYLK